MPRVLADGKVKVTYLTDAPENAAAPTAEELNAGHEMSCAILTSDFEFTGAASETLSNKTLCQKGNAQRPGAKNHTAAHTIYREYLEGGGPDEEDADQGFQAVKQQGTTIWIYARLTDKDSTEDWEAGDEIYTGGEFVADTPAMGALDDDISFRVPFLPQRVYDFIEVGSGTAG